MINDNLTKGVNNDLMALNLKISNYVNWKEYFNEQSAYLNFEVLHEAIVVSSYEKICACIEERIFISPRDFKQALRKHEGKYIGRDELPLFAISTGKFEPI